VPTVVRVKETLSVLTEAAGVHTAALRRELDDIKTHMKVGKEAVEAFVKMIHSWLGAADDCFRGLDAFVQGVEALAALLHPKEMPKGSKTLLAEYAACLAKQSGEADCPRPLPFLACGIALSKARKAVIPLTEMDPALFVHVDNLPSKGIVEKVCGWLSGDTAQFVKKAVWMPTLSRCCKELVLECGLATTGTVDAEAADTPVDKRFLSFLISQDLSALASLASKSFNFKKSTTCILAVMQEAMYLRDVLEGSCDEGGYFFDALQHSFGAAIALAGPLCGKLLIVYSQMHTVMVLAAVVNGMLFADAAELFDLPFAKTAAGDPAASQNCGFKLEPLNALVMLKHALSALEDMFAPLSGVDAAGHNLHKSVAYCKQWHANVQRFLDGVRIHFLQATVAVLKNHADKLESAVPRWEVVFSDAQWDSDLAKQRILDAPKRATVKPLTVFIKAVMKKSEELHSSWRLRSKLFDPGEKSFLKATVDSGSKYLMVTAAVNTLIHFQGTARGPKQAEEILHIVSKTTAEEQSDVGGAGKVAAQILPTVLEQALKHMAAGMPVRNVAGAKQSKDVSDGQSLASTTASGSSSTATSTSALSSQPMTTVPISSVPMAGAESVKRCKSEEPAEEEPAAKKPKGPKGRGRGSAPIKSRGGRNVF